MKKLLRLLTIQKIKVFFKNETTLVLLLSLGITLFICCLAGVSGYFLFGQFWASFVLAFVIQFIVFAIYNTHLVRKDRIEYAKLLNDQLNAIDKYNIQITCAYCQQGNVVPILLNQENRFQCEYCKQISGVKMQFFSTQVTTPLEKVVLPGATKEEAVIFNVTTNS